MNVLLLSDFSRVAINATHYAMDLLQDHRIHFYLLNIHDPDPDNEGNMEIKKTNTLATLDERVQKLQKRAGDRDHKVTGHYSEDTLVNTARRFVNDHKIDLIVMGAVGHQERRSTILGKHTFEIMSKVKCNILAVTEDSSFRVIEKILIPVDFSVSLGKRNIRFLDNFAFFQPAKLQVCELVNKNNEVRTDIFRNNEVFDGLDNLEVEYSKLDETAMLNREIFNKVQKKFDWIVLLGKNLKICDRLLHNEHGIYTSIPNRLPILVLHD